MLHLAQKGWQAIDFDAVEDVTNVKNTANKNNWRCSKQICISSRNSSDERKD